ncbi:hypothetical protein LOZ51_002432 [Ophidiomyces ophidiicola]|nr:hypothetical protein LOZ51_002432 [Ophidiomyces ophidiicola]
MQQQSFYENAIPIAISELRSDKQIPTLCQYFDGGQCRVFKVIFTDGESWAVRVPLFAHASQNNVIQLLMSEAHILEELGLAGFSWAAKLQACSFTFNNAIRYPFIVLTWIPGNQLSWSDEFPTRPIRNKILDQVAKLHISLIECTKEAKLDEAPFAIDHGDISPRNILIDGQHNVTGIIDWGFSSRVPFQQAACFPRFLHSQNIEIAPSSTLLKDREMYITSIQCQKPSTVASMMIQVLSSKNADFQDCFLESIVSKGMHRRLARNGWKLPSCGQGDNGEGNESEGRFV